MRAKESVWSQNKKICGRGNYYSSKKFHNQSNKIDYQIRVTCDEKSSCRYLNWIEQWLQNKRPFLKCKLFYNEMNFLKKNCVLKSKFFFDENSLAYNCYLVIRTADPPASTRILSFWSRVMPLKFYFFLNIYANKLCLN